MVRANTQRRGAKVRTRVLGGLVFMTALALAGAGLTAFYFERLRLDDNIDDSLHRNIEEFSTLAREGLDARTGEHFASVQELLRTGLQRIARAPNEGAIAYVDGVVTNYAPTTVELRLEDDDEFAQALDPILKQAIADGADGTAPTGRMTVIQTSTTTYRVAIQHVRLPEDERLGTMVMAFDRSAEHRELAETFQLYALVAAGSLIVIAGIGWVAVGRILRPIRLLREAAQNVSSSDLSHRLTVAGNDDMAALTRTFNDMMERLDQAFDSQRQLLDDAGHELRTPLTIVQGHLELMDTNDPQDTAATKDVVLDELGRMNRLVDDLMTLAKARRPDFVLARSTDIAMLTDDVLGKARLLGQRRWSIDNLADVTCEVDPQRLTQALLQLCANAVRFSADGSVIAVGSRAEHGWLYLWVRDEGTGIAEEDIKRIFGRFERLKPDIEGSGLGLPIVRSIALAHDGEVQVSSVVGQGTTMTLAIPILGNTAHLQESEQFV